MRKQVAFLACTLIVVGCGTQDKIQELQQQKLTLDLVKAQNEQLAAMTKAQEERLTELTRKENDLRALRQQTQDALREIEQQKSSLQTLQEQMTQEKAGLQAEERRLASERETIRADELKNQQRQQKLEATRAELEHKLTAIREREEAERRAQEAERRAQEFRKQRSCLRHPNPRGHETLQGHRRPGAQNARGVHAADHQGEPHHPTAAARGRPLRVRCEARTTDGRRTSKGGCGEERSRIGRVVARAHGSGAIRARLGNGCRLPQERY